MSQEHAFEFHSGEHWAIETTYQDGDGMPLDLNGALAIEWAISPSKLSTPLHTASLNNGEIILTDALNGRADIAVPPASQVNLPPGTYYHESRVTNSTGVVSVQFHGSLTVLHSVTN